MNADEDLIIKEFIAIVGGSRQHSDEASLRKTGRGGRLWRRVLAWSLASIVFLTVWILGILGLDWLDAIHGLHR